MPNYSKHGKDLFPLTLNEFKKGLENGKFCSKKHRGFSVLLFHSGVRVSEALRAKKEAFTFRGATIYFEVGQRLKNGMHTPPLPIHVDKLGVNELLWAIENTKKDKRVFPYCRKTGYNIIARVWKYPHHMRLTKITELLSRKKDRPPFSLLEVKSWTGHKSLKSLDPYAGIVAIEEMGKA